jgi:hypothetical protein
MEICVDLFIGVTGDEPRECFLFRSIAAADGELLGDITGKRRNPVDLVASICEYLGSCISSGPRMELCWVLSSVDGEKF